MMNNSEYLAYLISVPEIGRKTVQKILDVLKTDHLTLEAYILDRHWSDGAILNNKQRERFADFEKNYTVEQYSNWLQSQEIRVVTTESSEYPELLRQIDDKPLVLFAKGATIDNDRLPLAIVGSRKITPYGRSATKHIVSEFVGYNTTIVSGGMYGVDMTAHKVAQQCELPTVAVLGFGFNSIYPSSYKTQFDMMIKSGATLITEYAPDVPAVPGNFPVRNRIVAGIAQATIVVEAAVGSGSLITAQCALDYGRVVGAVPGPYYSQTSAGTKWLINEGAKLVTSAQDILEELYDTVVVSKKSRTIHQDISWQSEKEKALYDALDTAKDADILMTHLQLDIVEFQALITSLELRDLVKRVGTYIERV